MQPARAAFVYPSVGPPALSGIRAPAGVGGDEQGRALLGRRPHRRRRHLEQGPHAARRQERSDILWLHVLHRHLGLCLRRHRHGRVPRVPRQRAVLCQQRRRGRQDAVVCVPRGGCGWQGRARHAEGAPDEDLWPVVRARRVPCCARVSRNSVATGALGKVQRRAATALRACAGTTW